MRTTLSLCVAILLCALAAQPSLAQPQNDDNPLQIPVNPLVDKLIDDPVTSDAERRRLALFHGRWEKLTDPTPAEQAAIALATYDLTSDALNHKDAPPLIVAEAALLRGEPDKTVAILKAIDTARAALLRARAFDDLGKTIAAVGELTPWRTKLQRGELRTAEDITAAAEAVVILAHLEGRPAADYQLAMQALGKARTEIDRLYFPASLAEARILLEKDNPQQAGEALLEVLRLNPQSAEALYLLGTFAANQFDFDRVTAVTNALRATNENHLLAARLEAEAFLTQKDAASARKAVEPMLALYPNQRDLLALLAAVEALSHREDALAAVLAHYDKISGENPAALVAAGAYLAHARQYPLSEKLLTEAVDRRPNWPQPRIELGLMLMQAGKEDDALKQLRLAAKLDPFNVRARNQLKLVEALLGYDHLETEHFVIKFRHGIDEVLARDMQREIETLYRNVTQTFEHKPSRKTLIEIMPDEQWFAVRITGLPEIWTIAACTGDVIAMTPPRIGPKLRGTYDWFQVVQHEFTHTVTLDQTRYRIPHWFTEAAAVAMEPGGRGYDMNQLLASALNTDNLFNLREINFGFVRPKRPTDRPLAYAQANWMYEYITHTFGHKTILDLMKRYRNGEPEVTAIEAATGQTADEFMTGFKAWATKQVEEWGLNEREDDEVVMQKLRSAQTIDDAVIKHLLEAHPDHPFVLQQAAKLALTKDDADEARAAVLRYAAAVPIDPWSHKALYQLAIQTDNEPQAIAALNQIDRVETETGQYAHHLAQLYRQAGDLQQADRAIHRALHREPYHAAYRELAATIALQAGDKQLALHHIVNLTLLEPDRAIHQVRAAAIYDLLGEKEKSRAAAEAARKIDGDAPVGRFLE